MAVVLYVLTRNKSPYSERTYDDVSVHLACNSRYYRIFRNKSVLIKVTRSRCGVEAKDKNFSSLYQ